MAREGRAARLIGVRNRMKPKPIHRANKIKANGDVSALCSKVPRKINLNKAGWTNRDDAVTCPKCLTVIKE